MLIGMPTSPFDLAPAESLPVRASEQSRFPDAMAAFFAQRPAAGAHRQEGTHRLHISLPLGARSVLRSATAARHLGHIVDRLRQWATSVKLHCNHDKTACALADHVGQNLLCQCTKKIWSRVLLFSTPIGHPIPSRRRGHACPSPDHLADLTPNLESPQVPTSGNPIAIAAHFHFRPAPYFGILNSSRHSKTPDSEARSQSGPVDGIGHPSRTRAKLL